MSEIVFIVEELQDGGYFAKAAEASIITQGDSIDELKTNIADAVRCYFDDGDMSKLIHLHITHEETYAL